MIIESIEDYRKSYQDTYLKFKRGAKDIVVYYREDEDGESFILGSPVYGSMVVSRSTMETSVSAHFPVKGLYNVENNLVFVSKNPVRQWKKAPNGSNILLQLLNNSNRYQATRLVSSLMEEIFFPMYPKNTEEALETKFKSGIAINLHLGVTKAPEKMDAEFILWYGTAPVGVINKEAKEITVKFSPLYQEIADIYAEKEPEWKVHLKI